VWDKMFSERAQNTEIVALSVNFGCENGENRLAWFNTIEIFGINSRYRVLRT